MPEGPEIWRTADLLNEALKGDTVREIYFSFDKLKPFEDKIEGKMPVAGVEARGKAMLTLFDEQTILYSHNQLYGKWAVKERGEQPDPGLKLRVAIHNDSHSAYLYSATDIEMLSRDQLSEHEYLRKLGPDVLHPETVFDDIHRRFQNEEFENRKLTSLLLDQRFIAGIGNYLRSEIMFYAGVDPMRKLREYSREQREMLARATIRLSRRSYETGGVTNDPEIVDALKREKASRSQYRHFVYKRTSEFCHKCGTEIQEKKVGGRKIYFCPRCQKR